MAITFDNDGKPAYMFKQGASSSDGVWYAVGAKVDTSAAYEFTGANSFTNTVLFDDAVTATNGWNNFLNPAARDAALATPVRGTICFVRQDAGGAALNQIQSYDGSAWVASGDVFGVTAGTGISGGGTSGTVTVSIDTSVVTDLTTAQTLTNKTLTDPKINLSINAQTGTTYTLVLADNGKFITSSNTSAITVTIPPNSSVAYATGAQVNIIQKGAGQVTISQGSGVTIRSTGATATAPQLRAQYSSATCIYEGSDIWYVVGDIA
jgi:hypothetical protein